MTTRIEQFAADVGRHIFLREFSFSKNTFRAACGEELELADHVIALPNETLAFQIKERDPSASSAPSSLAKWFKSKVLRDGCGQLADSQTFLKEQPSLLVKNQRGHTFDLAKRSAKVTKILIHSCDHATVPEEIRSCRHRISKRAGFVHVLSFEDYENVCRCLLLPYELCQYFEFRESFLAESTRVPVEEAMLVAMFISEAYSPLTNDEARSVLESAVRDNGTIDLGPILREYGDRVTYADGAGTEFDYYAILEEFSRLHRGEVRALRKLISWALERAGAPTSEIPARLKVGSCAGFVVFPVPKNLHDQRINALMNFTTAFKYDWHLERAIGLSVSKDGKMVDLDWCRLSSPWQPDPELERHLADNYPFRSAPSPSPHYRYPG